MTLTADHVKTLFLACESAGLRRPDTLADAPSVNAAAAIYVAALPGMTPADLDAALLVHLRDPERGRWWPSPADLLAAATAPAIEADLTAWAQLERVLYNRRLAAGLSELPPRHRAALAAIGGSWALTRAEESAVPGLRRRFLAACKDQDGPPLLGTTPAPVLRLLDHKGGSRA